MELSFQTGDIIYVYGDMDDDGFYMGELGGHRGLVPSNFLQDAPQDYADDHRSGSVESQGYKLLRATLEALFLPNPLCF